MCGSSASFEVLVRRLAVDSTASGRKCSLRAVGRVPFIPWCVDRVDSVLHKTVFLESWGRRDKLSAALSGGDGLNPWLVYRVDSELLWFFSKATIVHSCAGVEVGHYSAEPSVSLSSHGSSLAGVRSTGINQIAKVTWQQISARSRCAYILTVTSH